MKKLMLLIILIFSINAKATIRIAVIDTGFDFKNPRGVKLCKTGHLDTTDTSIQDSHGHGTHVAGIIASNAGNSDYCLVIIKYYLESGSLDNTNAVNSVKALQHALNIGVDVINYSGGGYSKIPIECDLIKKALNNGTIIVTAAGNDYTDISKRPYYPAMCDNRVIIIGNTNGHGFSAGSNFGTSIDGLERGIEVMSILPGNRMGIMTGTSQAAAIRTGKIVKELANRKKVKQKEFTNQLILLP